jgi:hypothetical protein
LSQSGHGRCDRIGLGRSGQRRLVSFAFFGRYAGTPLPAPAVAKLDLLDF